MPNAIQCPLGAPYRKVNLASGGDDVVTFDSVTEGFVIQNENTSGTDAIGFSTTAYNASTWDATKFYMVQPGKATPFIEANVVTLHVHNFGAGNVTFSIAPVFTKVPAGLA